MNNISRRSFIGTAGLMTLFAGCAQVPAESGSTQGSASGSKDEPAEPEEPKEPETIERKTIALMPCEYEEREIWCERDGLKMYGVAYIPQLEGDELPPLVLCCHGMAGDHSAMVDYAQHFAANGIAAYAFDFCGGGAATDMLGNPSNQSDGATTDMSILTERDDVYAVLETAKTWDWCDANQLYLMGFSQGGVVSTIVAEELGDKVMGLMLLSPAFVMHDDAVEAYDSEDDIPDEVFFMGITVGKPYYEAALGYDFEDTISKVTCPIIICHGDFDFVVSYDYSERAAKVSGAELHIIKNGGHGFGGEQLEEAISYIDAWITSL